jgi:hemolysin III
VTGSAALGSPAPERRYSERENRADRWVHRIGISAGLAATLALLTALAVKRDAGRLLAGIVYAGGLMAMLSFSAAYHLAPPSPRKDLLQRFDHAAIFVMIAGTYTPFLVVVMSGPMRWALLAGIWGVAVLGSALKLAYPRRREGLAVLAYLLLGWGPLLILVPLYGFATPEVIPLLALGGVLYTVGVLFYLWESLPYQRAIWHGMVLAAAAVHYAAVVLGIVVPMG